jgi:hypothetical protein
MSPFKKFNQTSTHIIPNLKVPHKNCPCDTKKWTIYYGITPLASSTNWKLILIIRNQHCIFSFDHKIPKKIGRFNHDIT